MKEEKSKKAPKQKVKKEIQKLVWKFIYEFRDEVIKKCAEGIDFIIIYGSAVRNEFVPGKSDVDIVFQIFNEKNKKSIEKTATNIFWNLAKKYPSLGFEKALSVSKSKKRNVLTKILEKVEKSTFLYVPIFIFVKGEIDWKKGKLHSNNPLIILGKNLLVPQRSVFLKFKQEGHILFGRDIRQEIKVKLTLLDRLRQGLVPQLLSFIGFLISPFTPKKALNYATKSLLYQTLKHRYL